MQQRCTCGAQLPPASLFCHKCGKPQREDLLTVEPEALPPPPPPLAAPPPPPPIGFHNGPAVRVALLAGTISIGVLLLAGQLGPFRPFVLAWPVVTGFLAVFLYQRRTGQRLSVLSGARLGWICGIVGFVIMTLMVTVIVVGLSEPSMLSAMRDQLKDRGMSEADVNQFLDVVRNPAGVAGALAMFFVLFTVLPAFGGAVGAKLLSRD